MKKHESFPSKYLKKEDFPTPQILTIDSVAFGEVQGDHGKETKTLITFKGKDKALILNSTNWDTIEEQYGPESDDWWGRRIELYHDPDVMYGGKKVGGIKVRVPIAYTEPTPDVYTSPQPQQVQAPMLFPKFEDAVKAFAEVGLSQQGLIDYLRTAGRTGYNPERDSVLIADKIALIKLGPKTDAPLEEDIPF